MSRAPEPDDPITMQEASDMVFGGTVSPRWLKGEVGRSMSGLKFADGVVLTTLDEARAFKDAIKWISAEPIEGPGIYVVGYGRFVKIGLSSTSIKNRIASLQTSVPHKLTVYACLTGQLIEEAALHRRFTKYRLHGEWFKKLGDLRAWIEGGCR